MKNFDLAGARKAHAARSTRVQDVLAAWELDATCRLEWHRHTIAHCRAAMTQLARSAGAEDIGAITVDDVLEWMGQQPSSKTRSNKRTSASAVFEYARMRGLIAVNPVSAVRWKSPRASRPIGRALTKDQAWRLINVARRTGTDSRFTGVNRARIYMFLWGTALRREEAQRQLWNDVEWDTGMMRVTKGKVDRGDRIPLPDWLLADMRTWPRDSPKIFKRFAAYKSISKDMTAAGIEGRGRFHRFRSGAATYLFKCGCDLPTVAKLTRHEDLNTLRKSYIDIELTQLVAAQSLMAG